MVLKTELRHGSFYLFDNELIRYDVEKGYKFLCTDHYIMNLDKIKITPEIFDLIKANVRAILDKSFQGGVYASFFLPEKYKYYVLEINKIKISDLYYIHEIQNLISALYDKEIEIKADKLSDLIKMARV